MPIAVRKLTSEEAAATDFGHNGGTESASHVVELIDSLRQYSIGDVVTLDLRGTGATRRQMKARVTKAATSLRMRPVYVNAGNEPDDALTFRLVSPKKAEMIQRQWVRIKDLRPVHESIRIHLVSDERDDTVSLEMEIQPLIVLPDEGGSVTLRWKFSRDLWTVALASMRTAWFQEPPIPPDEIGRELLSVASHFDGSNKGTASKRPWSNPFVDFDGQFSYERHVVLNINEEHGARNAGTLILKDVVWLKIMEAVRDVWLPTRYWIIPARRSKDGTFAVAQIHRWLDKGFWGFRKNIPARARLSPGDQLCFYANEIGIVATARLYSAVNQVVSETEWPESSSYEPAIYKASLDGIKWLNSPRPLTQAIRARMDAYERRDRSPRSWSWLLLTTREISEHDFKLLTSANE